MFKNIKNMPEETRLKKVNFIKVVMSIFLYFVIHNNKEYGPLIKMCMSMFGITEEKFIELDNIMEVVDPGITDNK